MDFGGGKSMSTVSGTNIGPYEVLSQLGTGGMGEVYRARDTRLNRDVAVKVLPREFAEDLSRMARFEREAQLLASLNHPKIAAIYGLEESGPTRALVLELVEGPTLAERIGRMPASARHRTESASPALSAAVGSGSKTSAGATARSGARKVPIPPEEALPIAQQVAEALEYAHEHGVAPPRAEKRATLRASATEHASYRRGSDGPQDDTSLRGMPRCALCLQSSPSCVVPDPVTEVTGGLRLPRGAMSLFLRC